MQIAHRWWALRTKEDAMALPFAMLLSPLLLIVPALTIWALIDLLRRPASDWSDSGHDKLVWALVIVFVGFVGPVLYLTLGRSMLNAAPSIPSEPVVVT